jgi:hypothetical protein
MEIVLDFSEEIREAMDSNNIDLAQFLNEEGEEMQVKYSKSPFNAENDTGEKALVPIIIASAAAVGIIAVAISKLLEVIYHRPHFVEYTEMETVKDHDGKILLNEKNEPVYIEKKKFRLIEPRAKDSSAGISTTLTKSDGLVLSFKTDSSEIKNK